MQSGARGRRARARPDRREPEGGGGEGYQQRDLSAFARGMAEISTAVDGCTPPPDATPQPDGSRICKFPNGTVFRYHQDSAGEWKRPTVVAPAPETSSDPQATTTVPAGEEDVAVTALEAAVAQKAEAEALVEEARRKLAEAEANAREAQVRAATVTAEHNVQVAAVQPLAATDGSNRWCIVAAANGSFSRVQYTASPPAEWALQMAPLSPDEEKHLRVYENMTVVAYFANKKGAKPSAGQRPVLHGFAFDTGRTFHHSPWRNLWRRGFAFHSHWLR